MVRFLWENVPAFSVIREKVNVSFINAPMKENREGIKCLRPNTDDTVIFWLKENPPQGKYLAISNAPYIPRQDLVVRLLAPEYGLDTVGYPLEEDPSLPILLDEMARTIYQTKKVYENAICN